MTVLDVDFDDAILLRRRRHDERRFLVVILVQNDDAVPDLLNVSRHRAFDGQVPVAVVAVVGQVGVAVALRVGVGRMRQLPLPESVDQIDQVVVSFGLLDERVAQKFFGCRPLKSGSSFSLTPWTPHRQSLSSVRGLATLIPNPDALGLIPSTTKNF